MSIFEYDLETLKLCKLCYRNSYRIQIQCFHSLLNWNDYITKRLCTNVYCFGLYIINLVDNVVLVEARIIMCMSTHVCLCVCVACVESRVKGIRVSISKVSTFKDLFSSNYVLCSHVERNNKGINYHSCFCNLTKSLWSPWGYKAHIRKRWYKCKVLSTDPAEAAYSGIWISGGHFDF